MDTDTPEIVDNVDFNTFQTRFCQTIAVRVNTIGQIFGLCQAVLSLCNLIAEHLRVLCANTVKAVSVQRDVDTLRDVFFRCRKVHKGKLKLDRCVKEVEELAPPIKDSGLILVLTELVVCILKLDGLYKMRVGNTANPIRPHALIGYAVLRGFLFLIRPVCPCDCGFDLFFLRA